MRKTKTGSQFLLFGKGSNPWWSLKKQFPFIEDLKTAARVFLVFLLLAAPAAVQAQFTCTTNADNTITIIGYTGGGGAVIIPATITGLTVTGIGDGAFQGTSLTSVAIPDTVTSIGDEAFDFCTSLTGVAIPAGVTNIGDGAFEGCFSLTGISIPACVISLGDYAFQFCGLTSITFPGGVTSIGNSMFYNCMSLTNVALPPSVTSIGVAAFDSCISLASVYCAGNIPALGADAFNEDPVTVYYLPDATGWDTPLDGFPDVVLWNPQIQAGDANFGVQNNQFGFDSSSPANLTVEVEACSDLSSPVWIPLQTLTLTNGSAYFSEPLQINSAGRFYALGFP